MMKYKEFMLQDEYCKENNIPEGAGCANCPAKDQEHCADALRNLASRLVEALDTDDFVRISDELHEVYGLSPYNQVAIFKGELEFPE